MLHCTGRDGVEGCRKEINNYVEAQGSLSGKSESGAPLPGRVVVYCGARSGRLGRHTIEASGLAFASPPLSTALLAARGPMSGPPRLVCSSGRWRGGWRRGVPLWDVGQRNLAPASGCFLGPTANGLVPKSSDQRQLSSRTDRRAKEITRFSLYDLRWSSLYTYTVQTLPGNDIYLVRQVRRSFDIGSGTTESTSGNNT